MGKEQESMKRNDPTRLKNNQISSLNMKIILTEMKSSVYEFNHRLDTIEERINKPGYAAIGMILAAAQRERGEDIKDRS